MWCECGTLYACARRRGGASRDGKVGKSGGKVYLVARLEKGDLETNSVGLEARSLFLHI